MGQVLSLTVLAVRINSPLGEKSRTYKVPWQQANQMDDDALASMLSIKNS